MALIINEKFMDIDIFYNLLEQKSLSAKQFQI